MTITTNKNKVSFTIEINLDDLILNISHRSSVSLHTKDIKDYFDKNPKELEKYLKICKKEITKFGSNELDENSSVIDYTEKLEKLILKSEPFKKKLF